MNIADQIMRRADRAFAEASGRILIEDLSPMERKAEDDAIETKARYVRTPAGVRRFKRPIGSIILPRGMGSLDQIRYREPKFKGFDLIEDRKGNLYDIGKDPASGGKYVVLKHNTWDDQLPPQDTLDKALAALNEKLGGGTNSDAEEGEKPAPKAKKPAPKKTPSKEPSSDSKPQASAPSKGNTSTAEIVDGKFVITTPDGKKHTRTATGKKPYTHALIRKNKEGSGSDRYFVNFATDEGKVNRESRIGAADRAHNEIIELPTSGNDAPSTPEPQGDAPASDDNVASSDPRKRSAKFKRAADNMDRALDAVDSAKTEDDYRRALVDLEKSTVEMEDYIKSKGSEEDFARSALPKIERAKAKARSQIKRMEAKRKDQASAGAPKPKAASKGAPGSPERDAFIESHPKIKDVTDYHKPKLRDMSEKNFEAYVAAVEGGKSPNSIGPIMDRIDAGASWNPVTEKWVGQNSTKRPTSPTPTGDTSASDAADAAVRDRVQKMKDADRSKGRTNPYTSSLKPHQKDEVDALTPGEYATYMNQRDMGRGHMGAMHALRNQPKSGYKGSMDAVDSAIKRARKNLSPKMSGKEQLAEIQFRERELQQAHEDLSRHSYTMPEKLDQMGPDQKRQQAEMQKKTQEVWEAESILGRKRGAALEKARKEEAERTKHDGDTAVAERGKMNAIINTRVTGTPDQRVAKFDALIKEMDELGKSITAIGPEFREARRRLHERQSDALKAQGDERRAREQVERQRQEAEKANARTSEDTARNQKNREARENAEQDSRFGNTATFVSANQDLIKKIVSLGRSGKDPYPHISEARARLAEIDKRLSWTDDELGGYHLGKGKAESDERAAQFRKTLQSQRTNYQKAVTLMEDLKAKRPKPAGDQHQDMGDIERIGREARERQQAEAGAPSSSDAPKHTSAFLDTPISTSRDVAEEIRNIQDHAKNASHIRREDAARERVKDIDKGIEILKKLQDDKDGPMTARQRRDADTAIKYAQDVKKRLEARFSGDGESNPITAPDEAGDRLRALKETQKEIGRLRKITKFQADQYDAATTEEAKERYANGLRNRQKTLAESQAHLDERSQGLDLSGSDSTGLKRAQNALKRAQEDIDHVLEQEGRRQRAQAAQQSQSTSGGASEALKSEAGEYRSKARDLSKRIRDALSDTTSQDEAYRDRLRALDAEYVALLPRNRQIQDAHFGSDKATQDELRGVANAAQEMGRERNRLATRLNGVNIALERQQNRRPQAKRTETTPSKPREVSSPAPAQERVKGVDSTVSLAKTQAQKARRARTEKSARDHINTLNSTERDLNRTLERSGDRMPADQRAEVEQALQEIRAARAKAEENIPLNQRTHLRPQDLPALREEAHMYGRRGRPDPDLASAEALHEALPSKSTGRYQEFEMDVDALDQMVTDGTAPSVPEMNRAIRAMEAENRKPDGDDYDEPLKDLKRARDYIKDRLDRERAEFEAANTSLFGDDLSIPEPTPARPRSAVERAQDALNAYDERARNAPRPDRGMESMRFHQSQRQLDKRADRDLNEALRQVRERNKLEGDVQRAKVQERRDATPKTPVSPETIKGADAVLIYNKNTQGADWHRVKRVNKTTVTTQGSGGWGGDDLRISHDRVVGVRKNGETILGSTDKPSNEPTDMSYRRGADRIHRAGLTGFTPNQARQVDEMTRDQWEEAQAALSNGESFSDVLGRTAVRNRRDPMAPPPVSRDEVQRRLAERRAAREAAPRPDGSTTQAAWGTSTRTSLPQGGGRESDDPIQRAVERGEISTREAERRRRRAERERHEEIGRQVSEAMARERANNPTPPTPEAPRPTAPSRDEISALKERAESALRPFSRLRTGTATAEDRTELRRVRNALTKQLREYDAAGGGAGRMSIEIQLHQVRQALKGVDGADLPSRRSTSARRANNDTNIAPPGVMQADAPSPAPQGRVLNMRAINEDTAKVSAARRAHQRATTPQERAQALQGAPTTLASLDNHVSTLYEAVNSPRLTDAQRERVRSQITSVETARRDLRDMIDGFEMERSRSQANGTRVVSTDDDMAKAQEHLEAIRATQDYRTALSEMRRLRALERRLQTFTENNSAGVSHVQIAEAQSLLSRIATIRAESNSRFGADIARAQAARA